MAEKKADTKVEPKKDLCDVGEIVTIVRVRPDGSYRERVCKKADFKVFEARGFKIKS